jgi:hypothetical protein
MPSSPDKNLVTNVVLAEYTALRAEVTNRISGQDTLLNRRVSPVPATTAVPTAQRIASS